MTSLGHEVKFKITQELRSCSQTLEYLRLTETKEKLVSTTPYLLPHSAHCPRVAGYMGPVWLGTLWWHCCCQGDWRDCCFACHRISFH